MKRFHGLGLWVTGLCGYAAAAAAQGDWAVYETYSRFSPAIYSVSVEIPKDVILDRYEQSLGRLRNYQEGFNNLVSGTTKPVMGINQFETWFNQWERQLESLKNQMLKNNRFRGAAFAVDPHHLVTLSTVVNSATVGGEILVSDDYDRVLKAEIQGVDPMSGVAVLKIIGATLSDYIDLDRTVNTLPVASYIMTIQRPYELPSSPFSGMIGGYFRRLNLFKLERYIQTDLPLYPGNEGSPVFSPSGQLIGMIATEYSLGRGPSLTFVIPSDIVADSAWAIIESGKRERGWISGIDLKQVSDGILVENVSEDSPAARSGLLQGDLIIGFDGKRDPQAWNFIYHVLDAKPNDRIMIEIQRGSRRLSVVVVAGRKND
ncbi:MAG: S1C family serine protease [Candidatus Omnitrophota bacterium]